MAIGPLRPGHLRIDRQTTAFLKFQLGTQTNTITPEHVDACERQTSNTEAPERNIPCSECPSSYVGQTGRQFGVRMKEQKGAVGRQDENSLLELPCLAPGHAFYWDRATVVVNGTSKCKRELLSLEEVNKTFIIWVELSSVILRDHFASVCIFLCSTVHLVKRSFIRA